MPKLAKLLLLQTFFLVSLVIFLSLDTKVEAFAGGAGTVGDPYQITTPAELHSLSSYLGAGHASKYYKLMNNIDLDVSPYNTGSGWTPIGTSGSPFQGKLDGDYKIISNLFINAPSSSYRGLFGRLGNGGRISRVGLEDASIAGYFASGAMVGEINAGGILEYSYATGTATYTYHWAGGMVGSNYGLIDQCYSLVNVTSTGGQVIGSLAGENFGGGTTRDSYARGSVTTNTTNAGGLLGNNYQSTVQRSYSTGLVSGFSHSTVRGLVGGEIGTLQNGYWDTQTTGQSGATTGATGLTTAQMKVQGNYSGWDFTNIWAIDSSINDGYPYLRWETNFTPNSAPNSPASLGPSSLVDGSFNSDTTPTLTFSLSDPDGANTVLFRLQIDDSVDFSSPVVDYTSTLAIQGSANFTVGQAAGSGSYTTGSSGQTLSDGNYYWRVKTIDNSAAESSYSTANSGSIAFKIDTTAPSVPGTPSSSSLTTDQTPTWTWTASTDSGSGLDNPAYTVEWSQISDFSSGTTSTTNTNSFTHSSDLAEGTWYFRVKVVDILGNLSVFSSNGSFVINLPDPPAPSSNSKNNQSSNSNQTTTQTNTVTTEVVVEEPPEVVEDKSSNDSSPLTYDITVKVTDQNGNPVEGARVELYSTPRIAYSDRRGRVTFTDVEKGEHDLLVFYRDQKSESKLWVGPKPGEVWASEGNEVTVDVKLAAAEKVSNDYLSLATAFSFGVLVTLVLIWSFARFRQMKKSIF